MIRPSLWMDIAEMNRLAATNSVPTVDLFFFEDPKATVYQFPLKAVADWQVRSPKYN